MVLPIFTGKVDGVLATVTLWRSPGSAREKRAEIKEMEREQDELGQLSLDGATDGDAPSTSFETFVEPVAKEPVAKRGARSVKFLTHAYRVEYNGSVGYGAFGRTKVAIKVQGRKAKIRKGCARVDDGFDHAARVTSAAGSFAVAPWDGDTKGQVAERGYPRHDECDENRTFIPEAKVNSRVCGVFAG